jgi:cytochrome c553
MKGRTHSLLALGALASGLVLTGCGRNEPAPAPAPAPAPVAAASAPAPAPAPPAGPIIAPTAAVVPTDAQRNAGATLASQGGGGSVPACNSCHGAQGEGMAATGFPRLAGQSYAYLSHELASYADGSRKHPVMQPIAAAMSDEQRLSAAAYFSGLNPDGTPLVTAANATTATAAASAASGATAPASATTTAAAPTEMASATGAVASAPRRTASAAGKGSANATASAFAGGKAPQLVSEGDNGRGIQGCVNCHGPGGIGSGDFYPYLAGQHAGYLAATLGAWADGSRNNDPSGQMPVIAKALKPEEIKALAAYYAGQPPRGKPIGGEQLASVGFVPQTAVTSGPKAATPPAGTAGQGTEQGAATAGSQGQGPGGTGTASTGAPLAAASAPASAPQAPASR